MGFLKDKFCELVDSFFSEQVGKVEGLIQNKLDKKVIIKQFDEISQRFFDDKIENSLSIEEINFPALNEYVKKNLLTQIKETLLEMDLNKKEKDKEIFLNSCINISKAKTENGKRIVKLYVETAIDIIRRFFVGENPDSLRVLLSETSENTKGYIDESTKEIKEAVKNSTDKNSFEYLIDSINPKTPSTSPFHFRNDIITFQGREYEQKEIYNFLEDERKLLWMAITGDGGSGKSKLMYHMTKELERGSDWKVIWLEDESLKSILEKTEFKYSKNLLFICDYGGQFSEKLRTLINRIDTFGNKGSGKKIRLIILEREGFAENCGVILEPMWYRNFCGNSSQNGRVNSTVYDKNKFMKLNPLNYENFKPMVKDYLAEKKKSLSDEEINTVIKKAYEIDNRKTGTRPLIILFVADAIAEGNEAEKWDLNKLVEHVIKRYEDHWKNIICKGDEELFKAVKEITAYATAVGGWDMDEELEEPLKKSCAKLCEREDINEIVCEVCEKSEYDGIWSPFEPDLVGEFYVLNYLNEKMKKPKMIWEKYIPCFSSLCWKNKFKFFVWFLSRCIYNYCGAEHFSKMFLSIIEKLEPKNEEHSMFYSYLFVLMTENQTVEEVKETTNRLKKFCEKHSKNEEIQTSYANILFILSNRQTLREGEITVEKLGEFWKLNQENPGIQKAYAIALFNLGNKQELKEREKTIRKIEEVWKANRENQDVKIAYARGLVNLTFDQDEMKGEQTIDKLYELWKMKQENLEVQTLYSEGLVNLIAKQDTIKREETISRLEELWKVARKNLNVQIAYAKGLVYLTFNKDVTKVKKYVIELAKLWKISPQNSELQTAYANGLFNLACIQKLDEKVKTVIHLQKLWNLSLKNEYVQILYAKSLVNLTADQDAITGEQTIRKLEQLWLLTQENQEVLAAYLNGLINLSTKQNLSEIEATIEKLKNLESEYPKNFNIQTAYAAGIIVKVLKKAKLYKTKEPIESDIAEIKKYVEEHKDNEELQELYNEFLDELNQILP